MFGIVSLARGAICFIFSSCCAVSQWLPMRNGILQKSSCKTRQVENVASTQTKSYPTGNRPLTLYRIWARNFRCILDLTIAASRCEVLYVWQHATFTPFSFNFLFRNHSSSPPLPYFCNFVSFRGRNGDNDLRILDP